MFTSSRKGSINEMLKLARPADLVQFVKTVAIKDPVYKNFSCVVFKDSTYKVYDVNFRKGVFELSLDSGDGPDKCEIPTGLFREYLTNLVKPIED